MPYSYNVFNNEITYYIRTKISAGSTVLDIGAGAGKYAELLPEYELTAVEIFEPYIKQFNLEKKYKAVYNVNIIDFTYKYFNLIIFGDVLEHLDYKQAYKVLKYAFSRCNELIAVIPYNYKQGITNNNVYEIHKQDKLTPESVLALYPMLKEVIKNDVLGVYVKNNNYKGG